MTHTQQPDLTEADLVAIAQLSGGNLGTPDLPSLTKAQQRALASLGERAKAPRYSGPPVFIGLDSEWVTRPEPGGNGFGNEVLSLQSELACEGRRSPMIHYLAGRGRKALPTLAQLVNAILRKALKAGAIQSCPDKIVIFCHFLRADAPALQDFWDRLPEFRSLGKTIISGAGGHEVDLEAGLEGFATSTVPVWGGTAPRWVKIIFVDTLKLTPRGGSLADAASLIGLEKLDLHKHLNVPNALTEESPAAAAWGLEPRYGIGRMDLVLRDFPKQYERYAMEDAHIALEYGLFFEVFARDQLKLTRTPRTIAGAASGLLRRLHGGGDALDTVMGREVRTAHRYIEGTGKFLTERTMEITHGMRLHYEFGRQAYHGGRNECFYHGPTPKEVLYDLDLPGAYATALNLLRSLDYTKARSVKDADEFGIFDAGLAWLTFKFPDGTRFPCLPVRNSDGLFFPLEGRLEDRVMAGAPEIFLALRLGAEVSIVQGIIVPWASSEPIFDEFTREVQSRRDEFPRETDPGKHELWKEIGNSCYGLLGQGLSGKNAFELETLSSAPIKPSALTEPFMVSYVTSFIRALVGEILAGVPAAGRVVAVVTDGLLTNVPPENLKLDGPLCTAFADLRERVSGNRQVLTLKHSVLQAISITSRAVYTARRRDGFEAVCSRGNVSFNGPEVWHNRHLLRLYLKQRPSMTVEHRRLISARQQMLHRADLVGINRTQRLNLRYDFKRRPIAPRMVELSSREARIAWDTIPWRNIQEAEYARVRVDGWSRSRKRLLRTMEEYADWEAYFETSVALAEAAEAAGIRPPPVQSDNAAGVLKRVFLQAGRAEKWALVFPNRGLRDFADALTEAGCPTTKDDVTYASRKKAALLPHCVPLVPETLELLVVLLRVFPQFEWRMAFRRSDHADVEKALAQKGGGDG